MIRVRSLIRTGTMLLVVGMSLAFVLSASPASAGAHSRDIIGNGGNPSVFPPGSRPYGASYGDWTTRWWQWAYSLPVAGHPLFDETGADCGAGQSGPMWFLGGVFNVSGTANRTLCSIPAGKALFFPILNVEWDNFCPPADPPLSLEELRATAAWYMDLTTDLSCEIDGKPIADMWVYRFTAEPFGCDLPSGNIWEFFGCGTPAGHYEPMAPDGYYLMLKPLPPGPHVLHFRGTVGPPIGFTLDITYDLTVVPDQGSLAETAPEAGLDEARGLTGTTDGSESPTTWGRMKATYR